jgi:peptidoglycan/xylan/chitin deacetylase (PgdA/CDA1 family)
MGWSSIAANVLPVSFKAALAFVALLPIGSEAFSADCNGNKDALGTARVIAVDPIDLPQVGTVQYAQTVPLRDHEVVLTFDDGPSLSSTGMVIDALAAQCVKAGFFVVGEHAQAAPELVRREFAEGHTVGTHSYSHVDLAKLSLADAQKEIQGGIDAVNLALAPLAVAAPFFRTPYLSITPTIEDYLAKTHLMVWSIDVDPEDWRPLSPDEVVSRTMTQLELKGSGIILMHDVQIHTAAALSKLLSELKSHGYNVVHVVYGSAKEATALPE